jgi:hypothetical protein
VTGGWRKLHNEELHNLHSSPSKITMIKSRIMKWAWHVVGMGKKERDHQEDQSMGRWIILRWFSEIG